MFEYIKETFDNVLGRFTQLRQGDWNCANFTFSGLNEDPLIYI